MFFFHAVLYSQSYPILLQLLCSTDSAGEGLIALLPNALYRIAPFSGRSKANALLDNIIICGRVVGELLRDLAWWKP
jgi:hypothetical protein